MTIRGRTQAVPVGPRASRAWELRERPARRVACLRAVRPEPREMRRPAASRAPRVARLEVLQAETQAVAPVARPARQRRAVSAG